MEKQGQYLGNIITDPLLMITTNSEELADLLDTYAEDWWEVLKFLDALAKKRGYIINTREVSNLIADRYRGNEDVK